MKIENSTALVTGGASGLGAATVKMLVSLKCNVVFVDKDESRADTLARSLGNPRNLTFIKTDVTDEAAVEKVIKQTVEIYKSLDIVVNCAGILRFGPIATPNRVASTDVLKELLKINVLATLNVCKYSAREMIKKEKDPISNQRGIIINVSSLLAIDGQRSFSAYCASKGAVLAMTLPLARDLGKFGIRVMTVCPSLFETEMSSKISQAAKTLALEQTALGRLGTSTDFSELVKAIIETNYLNGTFIRLDGGQSLGHF